MMENEMELKSIDECFIDLRNEIIERAVKDWKELCRKNRDESYFYELISFFKSEYCNALLTESKMTGADILDRLYGIEGAPERI